MYKSKHSRHSSEFSTRREHVRPKKRTVRTNAQRRDNEQPQVIKSNKPAWDNAFGKSAGLRPTRDAGIRLQSRHEIRQAEKRKTVNRLMTIGGICLVLLFLSGILWMKHTDAIGRKIANRSGVESSVSQNKVPAAYASTNSLYAGDTSSTDTSAVASVGSTADARLQSIAQEAVALGVTSANPTPQLATYKGVIIHLPVSVENLTEVAFHQASYSYALPLSTHMPFEDLSKAEKDTGSKRDKTVQQTGNNALLCGSALKFWRTGRSGSAMTAIDCGAASSSLVFAPVTGTVTKVCTYNYENKVEDYEIHIRPVGYPSLEIVLIHVKSPYVKRGETVVGGVTPLARVRKMSAYVRNQLGTYAPDGGNHAHIQLNDTTTAEYKRRHAVKGN
ncbi:MAG: hypothetical protein JJE36_03860 [Coriobacteriia bacterium]|nr:hypothetical protein [Coriobacteriia bacterium]